MSRTIGEAREDIRARADVAYPQFEGLADAAVQATVNEALEADATRAVAAFFVEGGGAAGYISPGTSPDDPVNQSTLDGMLEQVLFDDRHASLRAFHTFYYAGGAHPVTALVTYNVDLATGKFHTLGDIFKPGVDYLGFLSGISRRLLEIENVGTETTRTEGTAPEEDNFAGWVLARDGIEITFGEYQVASYAEGLPRILVLQQAMGDLVAQEGPLGYPAG